MPPNTPQGSAEPKLSDKLANEANEAAMLVFAAKSVQLTQKSLAAFLQRNLAEGDPALRARIGQLMETKLGEVLTALMLSGVATTFGGNLADKVGVSPGRMDALASKLRVHAMASGATTLLDELVDPLVAGLTELIRAMPAGREISCLTTGTSLPMKVPISPWRRKKDSARSRPDSLTRNHFPQRWKNGRPTRIANQ